MHKCPSCGERTISSFTKIMLGPGRTIRCKNCNSRVSVSMLTWVIFVSFIIGIFTMKSVLDAQATMVLGTVAMGIYLLIHIFYIPLEIRKDY